MIALFTDFGVNGPYVGQLHAVLHRRAPGVPIVDLFHDVPNHNIRAGAYLLPAYTQGFPVGTAFVCVVDPGVGGTRRAVILEANGCWYVGPDNGLLHIAAQRAREVVWRHILWEPETLSATFHGRDLFAPVAAALALGRVPESRIISAPETPESPWPEDLAEVLYTDRYGNVITGLRASKLPANATLVVGKNRLLRARTYTDVPLGNGFWYENSSGLAEIAINGGNAARKMGIESGAAVGLE